MARCQCDASCRNTPEPQSAFCKKHQKSCKRIAPLSGSEPTYYPPKYNKYKGIKEANNCFSYAFDYIHLPKKCTKDECSIPFPQPGYKSGHPKWPDVKGKRCPDLIGRLMGDIPSLKMSDFTEKCPKGSHKIVVVTDENEDYHFYRQDKNGFWSHKPGGTEVTNVDATGRPIYDPALASREYPNTGLNYKNFCGYMCVAARKKGHQLRGGNTHKQRYKQRNKQRKHLSRKQSNTPKYS